MKYLSNQSEWDNLNKSLAKAFGIDYTPSVYVPIDYQPLYHHNAWEGQKDSIETRMVKSELKKANWNNPLSAYNTSEYKQKLSKPKSDNHREKLSAAQSKLWKDNDYANNHANKVSKDYIVTDPQGNTYKIRNLTAHCKTYGLTRTLMLHVADGKQSHHKGWTCQKL